MITAPGDLHARSVRWDALPQPLREDADGPAPGAVDGLGDRALVGRRRALRACELADGTPSSSGAQT